MRMHHLSSSPLLATVFAVALGACSDPDDNGSDPTPVSPVTPSSATDGASNVTPSGGTPSGAVQPSATPSSGSVAPPTAGSDDDGTAVTPAPSPVNPSTNPSTAPGETTTSDSTSTMEPSPNDDEETSEIPEADAGSMSENDTTDSTQDESEGPATPTEPTPDETEMSSDGDTFGPDVEGSCTASQPANSNASGSGPYEVVVETNSDPGINEGTIFRPAQLGGDDVFPILVWGQGGCSLNGLSNADSMAEIASHGYFVVADGTPNGSGSRMMNTNDVASMGQPLLAYVDWALTENAKPCSAYYHALDATKIAANGFSCGGLMSTGTAGDPRITTWGSTSSGTFNSNQALYQSVHTPVLIIEGGPSDIAYENGLRDYESISPLGHPIMFFSKDIGHGGDLFQRGGGDFTKIHLAWLNWWLKGDETASGKGLLVGAGCSYCTDNAWEVMSANVP